MRRVLLISTYFTSDVAIGSARMTGLAKYLRDFDWEPTVLTPELPSEPALPPGTIDVVEYPDVFVRVKKLLGREAHQSFSLGGDDGRSPIGDARRALLRGAQFLAVPDPFVGWYPAGLLALRRLRVEGRRFDAILSSSNPKTPHLLGAAAHRIFDAPWVADLRDFWTIDHYYPWAWPRRPLERRLERRTLGAANAVVTVSSPYAERLSTFLGRPVETVLNGFDPAVWNEPPAPLTSKLTFTYAGSFALGRRDPTMLLDALRRLADRDELAPEDVELHFYGRPDSHLAELARQLGLADVVHQHGYVTRSEVLRHERESHVLLLLFWNHPLEAGVVTGKAEYFGARRPILALGGPGGAMEELLRETGAGEYVHDGDAERLDQVLRTWYREFRAHGAVQYRGHRERVLRLSQPEMARQFADILDRVA
ncbi:MAG TPA: glycosyltransferase [Gaiellaceae bacterium]|nr:glycosyltransferase [Gaiellaceae bacterium]